MGSNSTPAGSAPPKSWERVADSSAPAPFKPPSSGSTSNVVEASGIAKPGEVAPIVDRNVTTTNNTFTRPVPLRSWQNYGPSYRGYGGLYGGLYGGGMYNSGFGGPVGGYGMGMGDHYANQDPNNPYDPPSSPPSFWMSFLRVMQSVVNFFGRISILIDQNTQAFHLFMTALLQVANICGFDRSGLLYGELAKFVLRILGIHTKPRKEQLVPPGEFPASPGQHFPGGPESY